MSDTQNTEEQIASWAELQFTPKDIARGLDLDRDEAVRRMYDETDPWGAAYSRGQLFAEAKMRKAVYTLAGQGSTPAQKQFTEYVDRRKAIDRGKRR